MAGDWIKLQKDTFDKPEVLAIATRLDMDHYAVVGRLCKLWSWFDTHTESGNASSVTFSFVDRYIGVTGFAEQIALVGWLEQNGHDLSLPNFDYHNGETAKTRALGKNRTEKARSNAKGNAESNAPIVTKPLPEKRREEKSKQPSDEGFDAVYQEYPKKVGRPAALKAWKSADIKPEQVALILIDIAKRKSSREWIKDDGQFIPNPATYINQRRWEDQPQQVVNLFAGGK